MSDDVEPVEAFRARARAWLAGHAPPLDRTALGRLPPLERRQRDRALQRALWDGGFAGICFPVEYGGLGLRAEHQAAFTEESLPYEMPISLNIPTLGILAATLVGLGTHEQKARYLPAILRGEARWVQFLSEPTNGSDLAGAVLRAERDGDVWVLNGSKIWSSGAHISDHALCLARTNWEVPKHRGLTMFIVRIDQPGIDVQLIRQANGAMEFCQEFFTDVEVRAEDVLGAVDDGWNVTSHLLAQERLAVGGGSPYTSGRAIGGESGEPDLRLVRLARRTGRSSDPRVRQLLAESHARQLVGGHLRARVTAGIAAGALPPVAGSLLKLYGGTLLMRIAEIGMEVAGVDAVVWPRDDETEAGHLGRHYPNRQADSLGGGSNEIQRNIIAERLLGLPREWAADRDVPFREVPRNR